MTTFLLPIADREPLAWIVTEQRTAFPPWRERDAERLAPGDRLLLYTTRSCFRNPTRDRGRLIGVATVTSHSAKLRTPVSFGSRTYNVGVSFVIDSLAPARGGVELSPLVDQLTSFPDKRAWSGRMRRALVPVTTEDAKLLIRKISDVAAPYPDELETYAE